MRRVWRVRWVRDRWANQGGGPPRHPLAQREGEGGGDGGGRKYGRGHASDGEDEWEEEHEGHTDGEGEGSVHGHRRRRSLAASSFTRPPFVVPPIPRLATSTVPPLAPPPVPPAAAPPDSSPSTRFAQLTLWSPRPGPPQHGSDMASTWLSVGGDRDAAGGGGREDGEVLEHGQGLRRPGAALRRRNSGKEVAKGM
ncbi:hypothetical protein C8R45DRAFT_1042396 [Mycena sanguinolenta]|nr:hypothetical protein C8R45DRAFT_1042396 [Mycena sanguinolenta]